MPVPVVVSAADFERRLRALTRRGAAGGWPRRQADRWILLGAVARGYDGGRVYSQREVDAVIQDWLLGEGAATELDHVAIRRALVDEGFLERDRAGHAYRVSRRHERRVRFEAGATVETPPVDTPGAGEHCTACRSDAPPLDDATIERWMAGLPAWAVVTRGGVKRLERVFRFDDFAGALAFADRVGAAAETAGHHPALLVEWGRVTVSWWTHAIGGLHRNDFVMARKTELLWQ